MDIKIENILDRIEELLKQRKETRKELAKNCQVNYQSFVDWKNRGTIPASDALYRIAKHLGVTMEYLLVGNGSDDVSAITSLLSKLDENDRKVIINMLKGLNYYNKGLIK